MAPAPKDGLYISNGGQNSEPLFQFSVSRVVPGLKDNRRCPSPGQGATDLERAAAALPPAARSRSKSTSAACWWPLSSGGAKWVSGNPYLAASAFPKGLLRANSTKLIATMNVQPDMKLVVNANDDVSVPFAALEVDQCHWPVASLHVRTDCFGKTHWSHRFAWILSNQAPGHNCASHRRLAFNDKPDVGHSLD